jgi:hypothetical protein
MKKLVFAFLFCSVSSLVASQSSPAQSDQQPRDQKNYSNCLHGYVGCDSSQLTDAELKQVREAAHQRNYNNCLRGYVGCDASQLTRAEKPAIQEAAHQRNYNNCLRGYAGCDASQLTEAEKPAIQEAAHQRNYNNCLRGYVGCDASQLTDSEKASVGSQSKTAEVQSPAPRYYTNKDGQRVQSPTYYDKPPAGATAQCRDGTYSFSQHRQGTCSHHGGVAKWL